MTSNHSIVIVRAMRGLVGAVGLLTTVGLAAGCVGGDDDGATLGALAVVPETCRVVGIGTLDSSDHATGDMTGTDETGVGAWAHVMADGTVVEAFPDLVTCRINGVAIGDSMGPALLDGATGYTYVLYVEDHGLPEAATARIGTPSVETLSATRFYCPTRWEDDSLDIDGSARVTIPSELPVTVGNAGNQWAWITFRRAETLDEVKCRYRGGASSARPCDDEDLEAGESYVFDRCTGEFAGTPDVEAGSVVEVESLTLHVHTGVHDLPDENPQTTVTLDLEVSPVIVEEPVRDFYLLQVYDAAGGLVLDSQGDVVAGDFTVESLD